MVAEHRSDATRFARRVVDVLVLLIMEEIIEVVRSISQERISECIVEQIVGSSRVQSRQTPLEDTPPTRDKPAYEPQFDLAESAVGVIVSSQTETERGLAVTHPQERISEKIYEQIMDVHASQIVEQVTEEPEISSRDRTSQCTAEQIVDVPVPEMVKQLVEVPQTISQDRIKQQTVKHIIDVPVPQAVEELVEVSRGFFQDRVHQRFVEQIIEAPAISLAEKIVEVPVIQAQGKTQEDVNTHVLHVVDTVEVEKPKIIEQTVQKSVIQEKINQVTTHIEVPQFVDKIADMPVVAQRQIPMALTVQKTMEVSTRQFINKLVDVPVVAQRQIPVVQTDQVVDVPAVFVEQAPQVQVVEKTVEGPQSQIVETIVETSEIQMVRGTQTSESLGNAHAREVVEIEAPLPTESASSMFVTIPVMQRQTPMTQKVPKTVENPPVWFINRVVDVPVVVRRHVPFFMRVQKTVEVPQIQFIDKVVDAPVNMQLAPGMDHVASTLAAENITSATAVTDIVADPSCRKRKGSDITQSPRMKAVMRTHDDDDRCEVITSKDELENGACVHAVAKSEMEGVKEELKEIKKMLEFLMRRERKIDVKTDVAVKRLERLEKENDQLQDEEHEASLTDALVDKTKVVKLVVDKWFVDKGFGFGKVSTGEIVFIHASAVVGAEVLTIGTEAWVQVVNDDARAQGGHRASRAWGRTAWKEEKDREKANRVAQQVRRAAALAAELAAQSEEKVAVVCDPPPGLRDELAQHIAAPNMGAGGSHPQAEIVQYSSFANPLLPAGKGFFNLAGGFRGGRPRSVTRAPSTRPRGQNWTNGEVQRRRLAEEKQQLQDKKEEAWELFQRQPGWGPKGRKDFEREYKEKVKAEPLCSPFGSDKREAKSLQEWVDKLLVKALAEDRKKEARERQSMGQEDSNSQRRRAWEKIWDPRVLALSPFLAAGN